MQRLEVSGAVRPLYWSLGVKGLTALYQLPKLHSVEYVTIMIYVYLYNKRQRDALFLKFILIKYSTCFGQIYCPSSEVSTLYTQQQVFVMQLL